MAVDEMSPNENVKSEPNSTVKLPQKYSEEEKQQSRKSKKRDKPNPRA